MNKKKRKIIISIFTLIIMSLILIPNIKTKGDIINLNTWYSFNSVIDTSRYQGTSDFINAQTNYPVTFNYAGEEYISYDLRYIEITSSRIYYSMRVIEHYTAVEEYVDIVVYENGSWVKNEYRFIFISQNLDEDSDLYFVLYNNGVFNYTYQVPQSQLGDLILSYVDIVPRTIQSLTSFEIFGFTLFAILGTFILVLIIIKIFKGGIFL